MTTIQTLIPFACFAATLACAAGVLKHFVFTVTRERA